MPPATRKAESAVDTPELPADPASNGEAADTEYDDPRLPLTLTIHDRMVAIMREVGPIAKTQQADPSMGAYRFRGVDQFMNTLNPLLARHAVTIATNVLEVTRETYQTKHGTTMFRTVLRVCYKFGCTRTVLDTTGDGDTTVEETMSVVVVGEGADSADKSATKALSTALKYALMHTFLVPVEGEGHDADQQHPRESDAGPGEAPVPPPDGFDSWDDARAARGQAQDALRSIAGLWPKFKERHGMDWGDPQAWTHDICVAAIAASEEPF